MTDPLPITRRTMLATMAAAPLAAVAAPGEMDGYTAYRRLMTSAADGDVAWWYFGTVYASVPGYPELPVIEAETVMVYRTETIAPGRCRIRWWEIGYFRDPRTGDVARSWANPVTGRTVPAPRAFEEGPAHYVLHAAGPGVRLDLVQAHADVISVAARFVRSDAALLIDQQEIKTRGFPQADGSLPDPASPHAARARTTLQMYGSAAALAGDAPSVPGTGSYTFELGQLPAWMGFDDIAGSVKTRGIMHKAAVGDPINAIAWHRLKTAFPHRFDGDTIRPNWGDGDGRADRSR